jgi:hypothetical protein
VRSLHHFGESNPTDQTIQIRTKYTALDNIVVSCGLPGNATIDLKVTPISGCSSCESAERA